MIKYVRLPVHFDVQPMLHEIQQLEIAGWKLHYNKPHYHGNWSVLALRSPGGNPENIFALPQAAHQKIHQPFADTVLLKKCPAIAKTLHFFQCKTTMVRLMKLNAGAIIKEHSDPDLCFESGEARFHIPLQTNEQVDFFIEEERIPMKEGECWYLNLNLPHRVSNTGSTDRIHLVIDCIVNNWITEQFAVTGIYRKDTTPAAPVLSKETRIRIIESLHILNTPAAIEMARKMELENGE